MAYKKRFKKRTFRKKRSFKRGRTSKANLTERKTILPNKFKTNLLYGSNLRSMSTTLGPATYTWRANSINDPDESGIGHQPRGHDQFETLFRKYLVIGSSIEVTFDNTTIETHIVGIMLSTLSTAPTTVEAFMEDSNVIYQRVEALSNGGDSSVVMRANVCPHKFLSIADPLDNPDIGALIGQNPDSQVYFHCFAYPVNSSGLGGTIRMNVKLRYSCILHDPIEPAQS